MNSRNLYATRTNPRYLEVQGAAQTTATVQADGSNSGVLRQGEFFRRELGSIAGTSPVWQTVSVSLSGGTNTGTQRLFLPPAIESYTHDADGRKHAGHGKEKRLGGLAKPLVFGGRKAAPPRFV